MRSIPVGLCQCGCGKPTRPARQTCTSKGWVRGRPLLYLKGHNRKANPLRREKCGTWNGGRTVSHGYVLVKLGGHPRADQRGYVREHLLVAEKALGRPVPAEHPVHHVNEVRDDNRGANLVLCQDKAYHELLHVRMRALKACGDPTWLQCRVCKRYDDPARLTIANMSSGHAHQYHRGCKAAAVARRRRLTGRR